MEIKFLNMDDLIHDVVHICYPIQNEIMIISWDVDLQLDDLLLLQLLCILNPQNTESYLSG